MPTRGSNKHSNLEFSVTSLGYLLCLVACIFSCLRRNAELWAVNTLPHRTCEQPLETQVGAGKAPRLQLLDLREEGIFFLPVPSPAEGGFVAIYSQD